MISAGDVAIEVGTAAGAIDNFGIISGASSGIVLTDGGSVTNESGGAIYGGIYLGGASSTVVNAGTINGSTDAIYFNTAGADRVIVDAGAVFDGTVAAKSNASNSIELAASAGAGTLTGVGDQFTGFRGVLFDAGSVWTVAGSFAGINWLSGFHGKDLLDLTSITYAAGDMAVLASGNMLELLSSTSAVLWHVFLGTINYGAATFYAGSDGSGGTLVGMQPMNGPPLLTVPGTQTLMGAAKTAITGIQITDAYAGKYGDVVRVVVSDTSGNLFAAAHGATLSGLGTSQLTLSGTLAQVNGALASLNYSATALGGDTISLHSSASGGTDDQTIAVTVDLALISWTFAGLANWGANPDWSGGKAPNDGLTDATLAVAGAKVQIGTSQSFTVDTLDVNDATAQLILNGTLISESGVTVDAGVISLRGGTLTGPLSLSAGAVLGGTGTLGGPVSNSGKINDNGGSLTVSGDVTGTGTLQILRNSTLDLGGNAAGQTINFVATAMPENETLILDNPGDSFGTINGFTTSDTIDLKAIAATTDSYSGGILTVKNGSSVVATLMVAGNYTGQYFALADDGSGGTDITVASGVSPFAMMSLSRGLHSQATLLTQAVATHSGAAAGVGASSALGAGEDSQNHAMLAATFRT